jgi:hypothetical protein
LAQSSKKKAAKAQPAQKTESVTLDYQTDDPAVWGKVFPLQYELYLKTVDMQRTKYGGIEAVPHSSTDADPRGADTRRVDQLFTAGTARAARQELQADDRCGEHSSAACASGSVDGEIARAAGARVLVRR